MRKLTLALGLAAVLGTLATRPAAAVLVWGTPQTLTIPTGGGALSFAQWNAALFPGATLVAAKWDTSVSISGVSTLKNITASTKTIAAGQWAGVGNVSVDEAGGGANLALTSVSKTFLNPPSITGTFTAGQQKTSSFSSTVVTGTTQYTAPPDDLTRFLGAGTLNVDVAVWGSVSTPTPAAYWQVGLDTDVTAADGGTVTLTYQYDNQQVPEPATWSLLGLGCVGLIRRKRAKKQA